MARFRYNNIELLQPYENAADVPNEILRELGISLAQTEEAAEDREWFRENFESIKAGYRSNEDLEEDIMHSMYPEGYDEDVDGSLFDDD